MDKITLGFPAQHGPQIQQLWANYIDWQTDKFVLVSFVIIVS